LNHQVNRQTGGARHRTVRAKHAAVARLRLEAFAAALTVIEELAGVRWRLLSRAMPAFETGDGRFYLHQRQARTILSNGGSIRFTKDVDYKGHMHRASKVPRNTTSRAIRLTTSQCTKVLR
jgi:hypothetical protein